MVMPAAVTARSDLDLLDADIGRTFRLELDPIAIRLDLVHQVPGDESRGRETNTHGCESDGRRGPRVFHPCDICVNRPNALSLQRRAARRALLSSRG